MNKTLFISRHRATIEWARANSLNVDQWIEHFDESISLKEGDHVIGTLPINIVAMLNARGIRYSHFSLQVRRELRGIELTMEQLLSCTPKIATYTVQIVG